jgi:uncharacterized membrane protein YbhN (UPF0104 family)
MIGLFWWVAVGSIIILLVVVSLTVYFIRIRPESHGDRWLKPLIIGGGAVLPTVALRAAPRLLYERCEFA